MQFTERQDTDKKGRSSENVRLTYTVEEVAEALGVGKNTAYELVRSQRLRAVKIGRRYLIPQQEVGEFLEREAA